MIDGYQQISYAVSYRVLTLTLNRPDQLNALTPLMAVELEDAFDRADADDDIRAIVLTGAGRAFCAGADLSGGSNPFDYPEGIAHRDRGGKLALRVLASLKPVIAAINGPAVGVGITMTLPADIRLASTLEFLNVIDYPMPAWAIDYIAGMEKKLGSAYAEPAADVRGYIGYVKSKAIAA